MEVLPGGEVEQGKVLVGGPVEDVEVVAPAGSFNDYVRGGRFNGVPELVVFLANSTGDHQEALAG